MSNESNNLDPIVAGIGFNDGANKGFWRHQPRDAKKQWMEMGAEVRALFNKMRKDGTMGQVSVVGKVAGSTGSADQARVLIQGDSDIPDGIYAVNSDSLEAVEAHLSDEYLKSQGIDPNSDKHGNPVDSLKAQDFDTTERADITQDDIDLINQGANSEKGKQMSKFKDSAAGKAVDAADAKPDKSATTKADRSSKITTLSKKGMENLQEGDEFFYKSPKSNRLVQAHVRDDGYVYAGPYLAHEQGDEGPLGSPEDFLASMESGRGPSAFFKGRIPSTDGTPNSTMNPIDAPELFKRLNEQRQAASDAKAAKANTTPAVDITPSAAESSDSANSAIADAWDSAMNGETPKLDTVINAAKGPGNSATTKKLIDLNPGDQVINNKGDIFTYVSHKSDGNGGQRVTLKAADGTTAATVVPSNHQFKMAPKSAPAVPKKAANAKPVPKAKPATSKQIDELDNLSDQVANDATIDPATKKSYEDLVAKLDKGDDVNSDEAKAVLDQVKAHFGKKITPKAAPTTVAPKRAPAVAKPLPEVTKKSASEIALAKKRMDDGGDIALNSNGMTEADLREVVMNPLMDEHGKPLRDPNDPKKIIQDPNAIVNAILEHFPDAKVSGENDQIILERRDFTDVNGKEYKFEMGVSRTYGNQFVQQYKFTDKLTGDVKEFQTRDYKDSFAGIFSKTNGIVLVRDQLLGEKIPGTKLTRELHNFFGPNKPLDQRLKYFRKGSDVNDYRLVTPEENIKRFLDGMDRKLNKSLAVTGYDANGNPLSQLGNTTRGQVSPFWEAMENKDWNLMKVRLTQTLGRMPDSPESRKLLIDTLRKETVAKFKGVDKAKSFHTYANLLDKYMASEKVDLRDITRTPYVMGDGTTVAKIGDKVLYFANHDQYSVGQIVKFHATNGKNGGYGDAVSIMFKDGTVMTDLQTRNTFPTGPNSEFGDPDMTSYAANLKLDKKLEARKALLGPAYDQWMQKRAAIKEGKNGKSSTAPAASAPTAPTAPDNGDKSDDTANPNAGAPYINSNGLPTNSNGQAIVDGSADPTPQIIAPDGSINTTDVTGKDATPEAPKEGNVTKLQENDSWYDEDGNYLGVISEIIDVAAKDGGEPGIGVYYMDENGDEELEVVGRDEDRGPK